MGAFEQGYQKLNDQQRHAVDQTDGPVLVIAGPGTGKTQLLALRVANILKQTDTDASSILCLTFTESAQLTMQQRLVSFMADAAYKVSVQTFHSFAGEVIARYNQYFDEHVSGSVADALTSFEILQAIFSQLSYEHPLSARDGDSFVHLPSVRSRISHLKQAGLQPDQLREILARDEAWLRRVEPSLDKLEASIKPSLKPAHIPAYREFANQISEDNNNSHHGFDSLSQVAATSLQQALDECESLGNKTKPLSAWRRQWLTTSRSGATFKDITRITRLFGVADIYESYQQALQARHLRDFDDLILAVTECMQRHPDLQAALQEQFQYILVDEYQDTNGVQQRLLELLADSPVNENRPNLMVVGDDDQAIYGFQGANPTYMRRFKARWNDVLQVTLTQNYRSTPEILKFAGAVIEQAEYHHGGTDAFLAKNLVASRQSGTPPQLQMYRHSLDLYWGLASDIAHRIADGQSASDIAIIAPRHRMLAKLVPYLLEKKVPLNYERRDNVLEQPHIVQLLQLARTIQALADDNLGLADSLLPELLSYPFWQVSTEQLWHLQLQAHHKDDNWLEMMRLKGDSLANIASFLLMAGRLARSEPLDVMLDIILGNEIIEGHSSPFKDYYFSEQSLNEQPALYITLLSSLNTLRRRLQNWRPASNAQLKDLLAFVALAQQAGEHIIDTHPLILGSDSVHVLTAHKSKGQEFGTVYLLEVDQAHWVTDRGRPSTISLPANLPIEPEPDEADEKLRRFYVSATRAANELQLIRAEQQDDGRPILPLMWLTPESVQSTYAQIDTAPATTPADLQRGLTIDWRQRHLSELEASTSLSDLLAERLAGYHLSASHLNSFVDLRYGGPQVWLIDKLLGFPHQTSPDAAYGTVIHSVLEKQHQRVLGKKPVSVEVALKDLSELISQQPLDTITRQQLTQRGERAISSFLQARAGHFNTNQRPEYEVIKHQVVVGDARLYGKLDVVEVNSHDKTLTIIDYKTGRSFADWQPRDSNHKYKLHTYRRQLIFYKLLLEATREFSDYTVTTARLDFVEPDDQGQINCLEMSFDPDEVETTRQLLQIVWQHMMRLDLPKVTGNTVTASRAFEKDLLNTSTSDS